MRIAMITGWFLSKKQGSGASVFIKELKEGLEERGVEVDLITPQFLDLQNYYFATLGRFIKNVLLRWKPFNDYDLIVCFDYDGFSILPKNKTPIVCCPRGIYRDILKTERGIHKLLVWFQGELEQINLSRADHVIANSEYSKKTIQLHYDVKPKKVKVIYTGIDIDNRLTALNVNQKETTENVKFLTVGKMYPRKNIPLLLEVFDIVHQNKPNTELHIVGDGIDFKKVIKLKEKLNSKNNIHLHGFVSDARLLKQFYVDTDVVCHFSEQEAFGNVVLEAFAFGKPVFALNKASLPEQVQDGYNGLLFDSINPKIIAQKITKNIQLPHVIATLGNNALKSSERFSREVMIENFHTTFQRMAGNGEKKLNGQSLT